MAVNHTKRKSNSKKEKNNNTRNKEKTKASTVPRRSERLNKRIGKLPSNQTQEDIVSTENEPSIASKKEKKTKITVQDRLRMMTDDRCSLFEDRNYFVQRDEDLYCNICKKIVDYTNISHIYSHIKSKRHCLRRKNKEETAPKETFEVAEKRRNNLEVDLCRAMVASNRLLKAVDDEPLKYFFSQYLDRSIPCSKTLKDKYLPIVYSTDKEKIKEILKPEGERLELYNSSNNSSKRIQIFVDSTTDMCGREVVAILAKVISSSANEYTALEEINPIFLLDIKENHNINGIKYASMIYDVIRDYEMKDTNIVLFTSDNATVMYKTAELLSISFRNINHLPCICHLINILGSTIQENLESSDSLIRYMNNYFSFSIYKKNSLKEYLISKGFEKATYIPQYIETRWSSFYECLVYHSTYIDQSLLL
ncbi:hypothetical protein WA158_000032 [Blastocystis sp. Blastoise]